MREIGDRRKLQKKAEIKSLIGLFLFKTDQLLSFKNTTFRLDYVSTNIVGEIQNLLDAIVEETSKKISPEPTFDDAHAYVAKWESFRKETDAYTCVKCLRNLLSSLKNQKYVSQYFANLISKYRLEHIDAKCAKLKTGFYLQKYKECRQYHTCHEYNADFYDMLIEFYFVPYFMENVRYLDRFSSSLNLSWLLSIETDGKCIEFPCSSSNREALEKTICELNDLCSRPPDKNGLEMFFKELISKLIDITNDPGSVEIDPGVIRNNIQNLLTGFTINIPFDTLGLSKLDVIDLTADKVEELFEFLHGYKQWTWEECRSNTQFVSICFYHLNRSINEALLTSQSTPEGESSDTYLEDVQYLESMNDFFNNTMRRIAKYYNMNNISSNSIAPKSWFDADCEFQECTLEQGVILEGNIRGNGVIFHENTSIRCENNSIEIVVVDGSEIPPNTTLVPNVSAEISYLPRY